MFKIRKPFSYFILCLLCLQAYATTPKTNYQLSADSIRHDKYIYLHWWKFKTGDDLQYAQSGFPDSSWKITRSGLFDKNIADSIFKHIIWFRATVTVDSTIAGKPIALGLEKLGASEIYIDGTRVVKAGKPSANPDSEIVHYPRNEPYFIVFNKPGIHLIAMRYSYCKAVANDKKYINNSKGFSLWLSDAETEKISALRYTEGNSMTLSLLAGFFGAIGLVHFFLYLFYQVQKTNLYYALFMAGISIFLAFSYAALFGDTGTYLYATEVLSNWCLPSLMLILQLVSYSLFMPKMPRQFWILCAVCAASVIFSCISTATASDTIAIITYTLWSAISIFVMIETPRVIIKAIINKHRGAWILGIGIILFLSFLLFTFLWTVITKQMSISSVTSILGVILCVLAIPIAMSVYLGREFAYTSKDLAIKLGEVETLSARSIAQEQEKKRILESQKEELEIQVKQRTTEVVEQKEEIEAQRDELETQKEELEHKNKEITDSITYARRLQQAILPSPATIKIHFPESFILYKPKDIVAGDFYWMETSGEWAFIAAADCTGHGVPGAMVSVVCSNALNRAVKEFGLTEPGPILDKTTDIVLETFAKSDSGVRDGMDISLLAVNKPQGLVKWAGAHNPLWIVNAELQEIKADKQPVGKSEQRKPFTTHTIQAIKNETIYLFSDGFADQFGGPEGKKLMTRRFKEILLTIQDQNMTEQEVSLNNEFEAWKGKHEQVDDVCIIGLRI